MLIGISVAGEKHIAVIVPHLYTKNMTSRTNRMVLEPNHIQNHAAIYIYIYIDIYTKQTYVITMRKNIITKNDNNNSFVIIL